MDLGRRVLLGLIPAMVVGAGRPRAEEPQRLRIGYQKNGILPVLKKTGAIESRFKDKGVEVTWVDFPSGPPLLEALAAGAIDFGTTGESPPIFAQAAGTDLVYVAANPSSPLGSAILVPADSPIQALSDLKGKRIAFVKGSSAHNFVVRTLQKAGIDYKEVTPVLLSPADAAAAFAGGSIDAWAIWDPFYALAVANQNARVLTTAEGIVDSNSFYLASREFATKHPELVVGLIEELTRGGQAAKADLDGFAAFQAEATGVPLEIQKTAAARANFDIGFITDAVVAQQQATADNYARLGLIPRQISIRDAVWQPPAT